MQKFQHCCLCPKSKRIGILTLWFCVTKVFALIQKLLVLCNVQCAMCSPTTGCNVMAFTSSHFAAKILQLFCFASDFALTQHLNIYKQMILFKGHIRQIFISLSYNFFVLKVERDTCILFEELKWMRWGKTIRTEKGDTSLCCLSAK